jgi:hypothetical protein
VRWKKASRTVANVLITRAVPKSLLFINEYLKVKKFVTKLVNAALLSLNEYLPALTLLLLK